MDSARAKRSFAGKKLSRSMTPTLANGGFWTLRDQACEVEVLPGAPRVVENGREQGVFAALDRVCVNADKSQQGWWRWR